MSLFKKLFGIEKKAIKKNCIITPLGEADIFSQLNITKKANGQFFKTINAEYATIIATRFNMFTGDCVMYLKDTPCENIFLFGSAGGIGFDVGDKILIEKAFNFESFSSMLDGCKKTSVYYPDKKLHKSLKTFGGKKIIDGTCASVSSLFLEKKYLPVFKKLGVNCVDMECSQIFSAAKVSGKRAAALFYISDNINKNTWHKTLSKQKAAKLSVSRKSLSSFLCSFIKNMV